MRRAAAAFCVALLGFGTADAVAQNRPTPRPSARPTDQGIRIRGVFEVGVRTFTASDSFDAVLGTSSGTIIGAGAEALVGRHLFFAFDVSRFRHDGQRVFVFNGQAFPLGIDTTVTVLPIKATAGWRFPAPRRALTPYVGGGIGWHGYQETSEFAGTGEDVDDRWVGYHVAGGAEWRLHRFVGIAGEAGWMAVPNAFTGAATSAAAAFDERDLGGASLVVKVVVGR